jgi:DNA polymerase (family 10)
MLQDMANNLRVAGMLRQIATLLDEQGVAFKPAAYRRAAQVVEDLPNDVSTYGNEKELEKLPGIGKAIAGKIMEFLETGRMHTLDQLLAAQGGIPAELMDIEGLGPKRIRKLQMELNIQTVADLVAAAKAGKIRDLDGFDAVMEQKLLENAGRVKERTTRFTLVDVEDEVETLLKAIRKVKGVDRAEVAGSYRRKKATVGDIDILVVTNAPHEISAAIAALPIVRNVVAHGDKKLSFDFVSGLRVDVRFVEADQWGAALLYFTGSKDHNIAMRKIAIRNGWKLNEYGLFEGDQVIASQTEEEIYAKLGLRYYEPTEREGGL